MLVHFDPSMFGNAQIAGTSCQPRPRYDYIYSLNWPGPRPYRPGEEISEGRAAKGGLEAHEMGSHDPMHIYIRCVHIYIYIYT